MQTTEERKAYTRRWYVMNRARLLRKAKNRTMEGLKAVKRRWYLKNRQRILLKAKDRYAAMAEQVKDSVRSYQARNVDRVKTYKQTWRESNPDRAVRKAGIRLSAKDYNAMLAAQGGACAICGNPPKSKRLAIDHDHLTIQVRALLCGLCNTGLGQFRDDPALLKRAATYLESHRLRVVKRA